MIEPATDTQSLSRLHNACFKDSWNAASFAGLLAQPGIFALQASSDGAVHGFVLVRVAADEAEIMTICVHPARRQQGWGFRLMSAAAEKAAQHGAQALFLEVAKNNDAAKALYAGLGFVTVGHRKAYYADRGEKSGDALVLRGDFPLRPLGKSAQTD